MAEIVPEPAAEASAYADEIWRGELARIRTVGLGGRLISFDYASGQTGFANSSARFGFKVGDVVLVDGETDFIKQVPSGFWTPARWVGIVRKRDPEETLVEVSGVFKMVPTSELDYRENATVLGTDEDGALRVLDDAPIRLFSRSDSEEPSIDQFKVPPGDITFEDFGGLEPVVKRAKELIEVQLERRPLLQEIGVRPIKGVLFTGRPGSGKTMLAQIIARESGAEFYLVSGPQIMSKWYGESEALLRKLFDDAAGQERAIIFFDEIDSVAGSREGAHEASGRVVAQFLTEMDGFERDQNIVVVAATNREGDLDPALRRPGRFDWEINFPEPEEADRIAILEASSRRLKSDDGLPLTDVAASTPGWSAAALAAIWTEAGFLAAGDCRTVILTEDLLGGVDRVRRRLKASRAKVANESVVG